MDTLTINNSTKSFMKTDLPKINVGDTVKVYTLVKENKGIRSQIFEGVVLELRHGNIDSTMVVRKLSDAGVFVEKIFALHTPAVEKIEVTKKGAPRRAKLRYLRTRVGKQALFVKSATPVLKKSAK